MRAGKLVLGIGAAGLLAAAVWLGRSATATAEAPAAPPPAMHASAGSSAGASPGSSPGSLAARAPAPVLARRAPAPGLAADLADRDPKVRRAAIREVTRDRDADPAVLLAASRDPDLDVGVMATSALGRLYGDGALPVKELVDRATDHALNERVRMSALDGLGVVASAEGSALLVDLLARGDLTERRTAAILLAHQDAEVAIPALIRALADPDEGVQANAAEALRARSRGRDFGRDAGAWQAWWQARPR